MLSWMRVKMNDSIQCDYSEQWGTLVCDQENQYLCMVVAWALCSGLMAYGAVVWNVTMESRRHYDLDVMREPCISIVF